MQYTIREHHTYSVAAANQLFPGDEKSVNSAFPRGLTDGAVVVIYLDVAGENVFLAGRDFPKSPHRDPGIVDTSSAPPEIFHPFASSLRIDNAFLDRKLLDSKSSFHVPFSVFIYIMGKSLRKRCIYVILYAYQHIFLWFLLQFDIISNKVSVQKFKQLQAWRVSPDGWSWRMVSVGHLEDWRILSRAFFIYCRLAGIQKKVRLRRISTIYTINTHDN
jgi:hypothetical protein